jgi:hypothetical protein
MNEINMQKIVIDYIKEVKKALPEWLKDKKEHKEILADLEEHLWQKAEELSDIGQPTIESVTKAISHMGTPQTIAKEYKRRGEPKVYITKELWPLYTKVLSIVFAVIFVLNILSMITDVLTEGALLGDSIWNMISGIQSGLLITFVIISGIFIALSMEGYFPEDFKSKKEQRMYKQQLELASEKGVSIVKEEVKKPFIKPIEEIIGGGIALTFGMILLFQPFPTYMLIPDFLVLLRFFGLLIVIESTLDISRGILGNHQPGTHQLLHVIKMLIKYSWIPFLIMLMNSPGIFPWFSEPWIQVGIPLEFYPQYRMIIGVFITIICLTSIEDIYRIIKIQNYKS